MMWRIVSLLILTVSALLAQPEQAPVFRADAALVDLDVQVTAHGRPVPGLTTSDFLIFDENTPQPIAYFGRESEPLSLLLLLDVSGSMRKYVEQAAAAATAAMVPLLPQDRVALMLFARRHRLTQTFTTDRRAIQVLLGYASQTDDLGAGTAINEAVIAAAAHMRVFTTDTANRRRERRAIVILTDNRGLNYLMPDDKALAALYSADAVLNAIVTGNAKPPKPNDSPERNPDFTPPDVFRLARETGGEAIRDDRVDKTFAQLIESVRTRYSILYTPPSAPPGSFRRVRVDLAPQAAKRYPKAAIHVRAGYFAATPTTH